MMGLKTLVPNKRVRAVVYLSLIALFFYGAHRGLNFIAGVTNTTYENVYFAGMFLGIYAVSVRMIFKSGHLNQMSVLTMLLAFGVGTTLMTFLTALVFTIPVMFFANPVGIFLSIVMFCVVGFYFNPQRKQTS